MSLELDYQEIGNISEVKGGKRLPKGHNLVSIPNNHPYIKVKDMANDKLLKLTQDFIFNLEDWPDLVIPSGNTKISIKA